MRRLLTGPISYARDLGDAASRWWNAFMFSPADPTPLGLIRVACGALLTWSLLIYGLDLSDYLGSRGWAEAETVKFFSASQTPGAWSFWFLVPDSLLTPVWLACLVVSILFTAGLWSRTTAVLAWIIVVSTSRRAPNSLYGFDQVLSTWMLYLAASGASGQAVSIDRFLKRCKTYREIAKRPWKAGREFAIEPGVPRPTISANIGLRLIQCHLALIYGVSGLSKMRGQAWWEGLAVWGTLGAGEFRLVDMTWIASYPILLNVLTHAALFFELAYPSLIWIGILRPPLIGFAILLHVGIGLTMGLVEFGLVMIAGNLAFVSGPWLRSLVAGPEQPSRRVLYDGACPRCRASMAIVLAADPDRKVEPIDFMSVAPESIHPSLTRAACLESMHVVTLSGKVFRGFDAVRSLSGTLPMTWAAAAVGYLPGVAPIGRLVYNRIAASRPRDVACTDDVCGLHPPVRGRSETAESGRSSR